MSLPYDMGNAGDLLKHGVLAEFVRWHCESHPDAPFRFMDPFGGKPWDEDVCYEVGRRVRALSKTALGEAQQEIGDGRYYGSGHLSLCAAKAAGAKVIEIFAADRDRESACKLHGSGLLPLKKWEECSGDFDGYSVLADIAENGGADLVLIDPFGEFLPRKSGAVVPDIANAAKRATVILFALNLNPRNRVGLRFNRLLCEHLSGAWRMTCPPLRNSLVKGEGKYYAEVVLAGPGLSGADELRKHLDDFAEKLAAVLGLSEEDAKVLKPTTIGR